MTRKFNTRHSRNHGAYLRRLVQRGLTRPTKMDSVERLREVQEARTARTGSPWWTLRSDPVVEEVAEEVTEEDVA